MDWRDVLFYVFYITVTARPVAFLPIQAGAILIPLAWLIYRKQVASMTTTDSKFDQLPLWAWIAIALILLVQSTWLYVDLVDAVPAILGFRAFQAIIQAPTSTIVYLFV